MFFTPDREHFFRPLTSKYREQVAQCLRLVYERLYGPRADYGHALAREQVLELFEEALARAPVLSAGGDGEAEDEEAGQRFKSLREQANWILKQLLDCGWLEKQVDSATLQSSYPFTRMGRLFCQLLVEVDGQRIRTRHRNTRNTLNALEAFLARGEVHDLLDAYEYSERIVTDFTDLIAELEDRKRQLLAEVESRQLVQQATDQFFEFMEKRFQPDVAVRLSADSVEKYRDRLEKVLGRIRRKHNDFKRQVELELRRLVPELLERGPSVLYVLLEDIEKRMANAADIMLPALRRALHGFTRRADIIIRQLSYLHSRSDTDLPAICRELGALDDESYARRLEAAAERLSGMKLQLVDPGQIRLHERAERAALRTAIGEEPPPDEAARRELLIQQLLDQAFALDNQGLRDYVAAALREGRRVSTAQLPVRHARDLLAMAHAIEVGAAGTGSGGPRFSVEPTGRRLAADYYHELDEFTLALTTNNDD